MFRLSPRAFALVALSISASVLGGEALAQLSATPAPPREDKSAAQDEEPASDSRAGGSLSQESAPADAPEVDEDVVDEEAIDDEPIDADADADVDPNAEVPATDPPPRDADAETRVTTGEGTEIAGQVVEVANNRLVLKYHPRPGANPRQAKFQVSETAKVMRNGEESKLSSLLPGDAVRIQTAPGDSSIIVRIAAMEELKGSLNTIRGNPNVDRTEGKTARSRSGEEEAVLPLGIEVYAAGEAALVTEMLVGGSAEDGGVRIGDLIVAINGDPIRDAEKIEEMVFQNRGGAELTIQRGDQRLTVTLSPARVVEDPLVHTAAIRKNLSNYTSFIGPVRGAGVNATGDGVDADGVEVDGVDVEVDPVDTVGPGRVAPTGPGNENIRENAREFEGREPGTDPRSNIDTQRTPGDDPRDSVDTPREAGDDPREAVEEGTLQNDGAGNNPQNGSTGETGTDQQQ